MKLAEIKLRYRDLHLQEKKRLHNIIIISWSIITVFWIWHAIARHDIVFLVYGVLVALCALGHIIYALYPIKVELHEEGIIVGKKFYEWSELKASKTNGYIVLKTRKGEKIPLPMNKLQNLEQILHKLFNDV
jgi:hypothetical protein